jgi:acyl-coenzyme A thioesterase PaaI-like protein
MHRWAPKGQPTAQDPRGGDGYSSLLEAWRLLQHRLAAATPPDHVLAELTGQVTELSARLEQWHSAEDDRWHGTRGDLPGRGHLLLPPFIVDEERPGFMRGHVTFGRMYLGANGVVHGGAAPLMFDDALGRVANSEGAVMARTAYLKLDYRRPLLIDTELTFDAGLDRTEGRKRWTTGRLWDQDGALLCEADALFVELRAGQR